MKAMILAAGRGERMRPLTDECPKPLLSVGGKPLIVWHIERLRVAGFIQIVINTAWLAERLESSLGDGSDYGVSLEYSRERNAALETGGGIFHALPLLGAQPFVVINGDVWMDYDYNKLPKQLPGLAHLVLVNNPDHNPQGDFALEKGWVHSSGEARLTFSGLGLYAPELFDDCKAGAFPLAPLLRQHMADDAISGEHHHGEWIDIGTPQRLAELDKALTQSLP